MVRLFSRCLPIICIPRKKRQSLPICEQQATGTKHHQGEINKLFVRRVESIRVTQQGAVLKRLPLQTVKDRHPPSKKTKSKTIVNNNNNNEKIVKPDDTEFDCETHISDGRSKQKHRIKSKKKPSSMKLKSDENTSPRSRTPLEKLFRKNKKAKTPSPIPSSINDIPEEEDPDDATSSLSSSMSSDWSTTTYPDSQSSEKSNDLIRHRQSIPLSNLTDRNNEIKHRSCVESFYLGREHVRQAQTSLQDRNSNRQRKEIKASAKSKQVLQNVQKMIRDQNVQEQHFNDTRQRESVRL